MIRYLVLLSLAATHVFARAWRPPDRFLSAVRFVESNNGVMTYGDEGRSLGDFQLSEAAWIDVSTWRRGQGFRTYKYDQNVYNRLINRSYAADYLSLLHDQLTRKLKRAPTVSEIYAAYNMGLGMFAQCNYELARVNPVTLRKCQQIKQLMQHSP